MITAVLDTNVPVQAAISQRGASYRVVQALFDRRFQVAFSPPVLDEFYQVLTLPSIQARHGWTDAEVRDFILLLVADGKLFPGQFPVPPSLARDLTDAKFLALAADSAANYLVTNDRRHLLRLGRFGRTKFVSPNKFLRLLA